MKTKIFFILCIILILFTGCVSQPEVDETKIDDLIEEVAEETVEILPRGQSRRLAVYYFTTEGKESPVSDYLINGLTTEIANMVTEENLDVTVVSRNNLESILAELSFQLSDLADKNTQLSVGRQLGADIILTGTITPLGEIYNLNAQLIEVETAAVLGGYRLNFMVEGDLKEKIAQSSGGVSEVITIEEDSKGLGAVATVTHVLEDFNSGRSSIQLAHYEDYWGEEIISAKGDIIVDKEGSADGTPCAKLAFSGAIADMFGVYDWQDTDLSYYFSLKTDWKPEGYEGLSFSIKPEGFCQVEVYIIQERGEEEYCLYVPLTLNQDEWHDIKIPFSNFHGDGEVLNRSAPITINIEIPYRENYHNYCLRQGNSFSGQLLIDNVGLFKLKDKDDPAFVETFNDSINRFCFDVDIGNSSYYEDYTMIEGLSEEEVAEVDFRFINTGVKNQKIGITKQEMDEQGKYLNIDIQFVLNYDLQKLLDKGLSLDINLSSPLSKSWLGYKGISFYVKSNIVEEGTLNLSDDISESYFCHDFIVSSVWSKVQIPFKEFKGDYQSLDQIDTWFAEPNLSFYFEIPDETLMEAMAKGALEVQIALDDFVLEK